MGNYPVGEGALAAIKLQLTGQHASVNAIKVKIESLKGLMVERDEMWNKIPIEAQKAWIESEGDPILNEVYLLYMFLNGYFGGLDVI